MPRRIKLYPGSIVLAATVLGGAVLPLPSRGSHLSFRPAAAPASPICHSLYAEALQALDRSGPGRHTSPCSRFGYLIPGSSDRYLSRDDLAGLSRSTLRLARNEIYARHGCRFHDSGLQDYFNSQSWYNPIRGRWASDYHHLSRVERANIDFISRYEGGSSGGEHTGSYLIPGSSDRYVTFDDIRGFSSGQIRLARNEIFARHGCQFASSDLQQYFNGQSWYSPVRGRWASEYHGLSRLESRNADFIKAHE